jgi:hypothetical protein
VSLGALEYYPMKKPEEVYALVGVNEIKDKMKPTTSKLEFIKLINHKNWNPIAGTNYDYDIALIELKKEITFSNLIQPVCLPNVNENVYEVSGTIVGHGITNSIIFKPSSKMKHVEISSVKDNKCLYKVPLLANIGSER